MRLHSVSDFQLHSFTFLGSDGRKQSTQCHRMTTIFPDHFSDIIFGDLKREDDSPVCFLLIENDFVRMIDNVLDNEGDEVSHGMSVKCGRSTDIIYKVVE